jgi:hypothetical protein
MTIDTKLVEILFDKSRLYYHCMMNGTVYLDHEKTIPLIDLKKLTGKTSIPREFNDYNITSGLCDIYFTGNCPYKIK